MDDKQLERAIGRLEAGQEEIKSRLDRLRADMYGEDGLEARIRNNEQDITKIKAVSGVISALVAGGISLAASFFKR